MIFNDIFFVIRVILGLAIALFVPGYLLARIFFAELSELEKIALAFVLSISLDIFVGLFLGYNEHMKNITGGITAYNVWLYLSTITVILAVVYLLKDHIKKISIKDLINNKFVLLFGTILYIGLMIYGSSLPNVQIKTPWDKILHGIEFMILAFILAKTLSFYSKKWFAIGLALVLCVSVGFFSEWVQILVPGRSYSLYDLIADIIGIILGLIIVYFLDAKKQ